MIDNFATRIRAAYTCAWISAILIETRQVTLAILINNAFRFATVYIRIANERWYARALGYTTDRRANSILAAR